MLVSSLISSFVRLAFLNSPDRSPDATIQAGDSEAVSAL
jgi:hypothetical protein